MSTAPGSEFFQSLSNILCLCSAEWESVSFLFSEQHQTFTSSSETPKHLSAHSWRMTQRSHQTFTGGLKIRGHKDIFIHKYWKNKAWMIKNELCNIMRYDEITKRLAECYNLLDILRPVPSSSLYCRTRNRQFMKTLWQSITGQNHGVIQSWH